MIGLINFLAQAGLRPKNCDSNSFNPKAKSDCLVNLPETPLSKPEQLQLGLGVIFGVAAGIAVLSLLVAAFNYATAGTDFDKIARSRKTIVYSLMGLIISLSAEAIVLTLIGKL